MLMLILMSIIKKATKMASAKLLPGKILGPKVTRLFSSCETSNWTMKKCPTGKGPVDETCQITVQALTQSIHRRLEEEQLLLSSSNYTDKGKPVHLRVASEWSEQTVQIVHTKV